MTTDFATQGVELCIKATHYDMQNQESHGLPLDDPAFLYDYLTEFENTVVPSYLRDGPVDEE